MRRLGVLPLRIDFTLPTREKEEIMREGIVLFLLVVVLMIPGFSEAQMHRSGQGNQQADSSMMHQNMGRMAEMMTKMAKVMNTGKMTPEHQKQCADIMRRMGMMMLEMSGTYDKEAHERHQKQFQEIEKQFAPFDNLYDH